MAVNATKPVLILKDPKKRSERPNGYLYATLVDGSKQSLNALRLAIRMLGPHDRIKCISAAQSNIDTDKVRLTVEQVLEENGVLERSTVQMLDSNPS